ncbi:OmpA family protein [Maridesulfovibrio hydrothermalis]|uniref:OmpA/MotB domain protein n=1 Tax=Maridesulfovibrio hydrothermalis AM13 = DSM 14728 TaxID=1121451 RepID=L0RBW0_9BACT|nr:OmpA family protein [Maridesulfovibrio hydrothermalis]CCO23036.1 OmpA/MotB domain protein [Maridesulfovibrio hydrothermalis AM13 = DSM 14728]
MGRAKFKKPPEPGGAWLVTFSDLVTLLLTFFVLLLSMASMDHSFITRVTIMPAELGFLDKRGAGRVTAKVALVSQFLERPWEVLEKQNKIKDLLFPDDVLPPDMDRATLNENLKVLAKPEGVALVLTDKLMFPLGKSELDDSAKMLLYQFVPVLDYLGTANINIAGYTDNVGGMSPSNFKLSGDRAMAVLTFFVEQGISNTRLTVSAYGPTYPMYSNTTPEGRDQNRRVEILIKTTPHMGGY